MPNISLRKGSTNIILTFKVAKPSTTIEQGEICTIIGFQNTAIQKLEMFNKRFAKVHSVYEILKEVLVNLIRFHLAPAS